MSFRTIAIVAVICCLSTWLAARAQSQNATNTPVSCTNIATSPQSQGRSAQPQAEPRKRARAQAKITVQSSESKPYDQSTSPALMEVRISETFTGDLDGESPVRALQVQRDDKSACLVSLQRFRGKLGGRPGTFVLQGSEIVENGNINATWVVVPGSGTGDLAGLRAEGGFKGQFGKGSEGWLDYWFE